MSKSQPQTDLPRAKNFKPGSGNNRYARFAASWLDVQRTHVLDTIAEAVNNNQQVLVTGANGIGKSFTASVLGLAGLYTNPNTVVPITAGTGGTLEDNIWKPLKSLFRNSDLPGRVLENKRELRTEFDEEWYLKCVAPKYPDDLEGDHNENVLYIVEEADKPGITYEHIDSVRSTVTDEGDRILVVANPPTDESNCVYRLVQSDQWHKVNFASWDSHNARIERNREDGETIGGLADIHKIKQDWFEYHEEDWPGIEQIIQWSDPWYGSEESGVVTPSDPPNETFRDDLHTNWYKRRAGVVPPQGAEAWRPFSVSDVRAASNRERSINAQTPDVLAIDAARKGGDVTVGMALYDESAREVYRKQGTDFVTQRLEIQKKLNKWPDVSVGVDAVGEGSALADEIAARHPDVSRYNTQEIASQKEDYKSKWAEGLQEIGDWLQGRGGFSNDELFDELMVAARVVEFSETNLRRGRVIEATSKEKIKQELGHSPDYLDSLLIALHKRDILNSGRGKAKPTFGW